MVLIDEYIYYIDFVYCEINYYYFIFNYLFRLKYLIFNFVYY